MSRKPKSEDEKNGKITLNLPNWLIKEIRKHEKYSKNIGKLIENCWLNRKNDEK